MLESTMEGIGSRGIVVQGRKGRFVEGRRSILKSFTTEGHRPVCVFPPGSLRFYVPRVAQFESAVQIRRCTSAKAKYTTETDREQVV
jgi:hypothetical protein